MSDFEKLRSLLVGDEIDAIEELKARVARLAEALDDPEEIIERLSPWIDRILERNIGLRREQLVDTLSPIIAEVLGHEIRNSGEAIARTLAPVIGQAIRVQITTQRDEVVDALYPVIGATVVKAVSQAFRDLLNRINDEMQNTFSVASLRRKLTAKIKGIPEADLLIRENLPWHVKSVFLIHKTSGLLLAQKNAEDSAMEEPEMVASMLTAIRSFVNDWISRQENESEINQIEYGRSTIYLEVAGSCYIAVVLEGVPQMTLAQKISEVLSDIVGKYGETIQHFSGDRAELDTEEIDRMLGAIFAVETRFQDSKEKSAGSRWPLAVMAVLLLAGAAYLGYRTYIRWEAEKTAAEIKAHFETDPYLALYRIEPSVEDGRIVLDGAVPDANLSSYASRWVESHFPKKETLNRLVVAHRPDPYLEKIRSLEAQLDAYRKIPAVHRTFYYGLGKSNLTPEQRRQLEAIGTIMQIFPEYRMKVTGFSDRYGTPQERRIVAQKRADGVKKILTSSMGIDASRIETAADLSLPEETNNTAADDAAARKVEIELLEGRKGSQ